MHNPLIQIITDAKKALAFRQVGENTITQPAAAGDIIRVRQAQIAHVVGSAAHPLSDPLRTAPGQVITLEQAILQRSRVLQAGAHLVVRDAGTQAFASGVTESGEVPAIAFQERAAGLNIATAAPFSVVTPGSDVSVSPLPVLTSKVRLDGFSNYGVRLSLTRDQQKQLGDGVLADSIMVSLALGIANVADHALLTAIAAAKPQGFSLAMAAAKGFRFAELSAIAGTAAAGAAVSQDGVLRVAGVAAELTDQVPDTLVGVYQHAGVALFDEIQVVAERRDVQGRLIVTAWLGLEALLPDAGAFFKVAAQ